MQTLPSSLLLALLVLSPQDAGLTGEELHSARAAVARTAESLEEVTLLRADYVQRQSSLLLAEPVVSKGRMSLRTDPGCLVLELTEPKALLVRSDATSHQIYDPAANRAERYLFESNEVAKALLACFSGELSKLEEVFEFVSIEKGEESTTLGLRPRTKRVRAMIESLRIELRAKDGAVVGIAYDNAEGEEVSMTLSKLELDPEVTEEERGVFDRPLPEGVELLVHRVETKEEDE